MKMWRKRKITILHTQNKQKSFDEMKEVWTGKSVNEIQIVVATNLKIELPNKIVKCIGSEIVYDTIKSKIRHFKENNSWFALCFFLITNYLGQHIIEGDREV